MKKRLFLPFLLLMPLALSSCDNVVLNVSKPNEGKEVSELTIPTRNDTVTTFSREGKELQSRDKIKQLKGLDAESANWDYELHFSAISDNETVFSYSVKNKHRYTNKNNKKGLYEVSECGDMISKLSSYSDSTLLICRYSYTKENDKYISMYANVPSEATIEDFNKRNNEDIRLDSDYEPGKYYMDDLPYEPDLLSEPLSSYRGILIAKQILNGGGWFTPAALLESVVTRSGVIYETTYSYKLTNKYLIITFERPYGVFYNKVAMHVEDIIQESIQNSCYIRDTMYFDASTGFLTYLEVSFKTFDQLDYSRVKSGYSSCIYEGTFVFKTQKESNEGYNEFVKTRKEVMKHCNNSTPR